jgi:hypothetical protein
MRCIIAGSQVATQEQTEKAIYQSDFYPEITVVFSGLAKGADLYGELWAKRWQIPVRPFPALWQDLNPNPTYGIRPIIMKRGKREYDKTAGIRRNERMALSAEALIFVMINNSNGTTDMLKRATAHKLQIFGLFFNDKGVLCKTFQS